MSCLGDSDIAAVHIADSYVLIGQFNVPAYTEQRPRYSADTYSLLYLIGGELSLHCCAEDTALSSAVIP
jgi:hypothetical protein